MFLRRLHITITKMFGKLRFLVVLQIVHGVRYTGGDVVDTVDTRGVVNGRQILADRAAYDAVLAAMRPQPTAQRCGPWPNVSSRLP